MTHECTSDPCDKCGPSAVTAFLFSARPRTIAEDISESTPAELYRRMEYHQAAGNTTLAGIYRRELEARHYAEMEG